VLLGGTRVGGIEAAIRKVAGGIQLEDRLVGRICNVEVAGAGGLVLPAQRHRRAFAIHAEFRLAYSFQEYLPPNCGAGAAKDFGITDGRVRLALMEAAMREGQNVGDWNVSAAAAAKAAGLDSAALLKKARSPEIEKRVRAATAEFHALQVTQRPAFVLEDNIGDRAVFSGLIKTAPIAAALDAMLDDAAAYASHAAHFGSPPPS